MGFELSPLLWAKVARGLSAGRVQSVAVRLVVEREREIRAFKPEEYWELFADLKRAGAADALRFQVVKERSKDFRPGNQEAAEGALARLRQAGREGAFEVSARNDRPTKTRPNPPFITSTLQQAASARMGYSVKRTMTLAQRLYEAGYITYMRTDSTSLSGDGNRRLPGAHRRKLRGQVPAGASPGSTPARPPPRRPMKPSVRPMSARRRSNWLGVAPEAVRLYDLIRRQFVACQMPDAEYLATTVLVAGGRF